MKTEFTIGEVSKMMKEESYTIRYWLTQFAMINVGRDLKGNRIFDVRAIELLFLAKKFLREDRLTLKGAKQRLEKTLSVVGS